jgi:D-3-phosphoglycerate dehydrogenase / 2-oxoglutarate reductase
MTSWRSRWQAFGAGGDDVIQGLCVGDRFVPSDILAEALTRHGERAGVAFELRRIDLPFPTAATIPLADGELPGEIRAFWEDVDGIATRLGSDAADPTLREYTGPVDALVREIGDAEVLMLHAAPLSSNAVKAANALRVVGTVRGGPVNVNIDELTARGIPVFNTVGRNAQAVAEFITGALIAHVRGIVSTANDLRDGAWSLAPWILDRSGPELGGKVCGLVGFGGVGRAFAPIAKGLGMELLVHDPFVSGGEVDAAGGTTVGLDELLERSDFVVLAARLTPENRHMIDRPAIERMKPSAILVNTARSQLVDTDALVEGLERAEIAGAIVDVLDQEPPARTHPLLSAPHASLTPHIAGATRDTVLRGADMLAADVVAYLHDGTMERCVNRDALATKEGR